VVERPYSKKTKANLNHEGHEDHEGFLENVLNLVSYQIFFVYFVTFVVNHIVVSGKILNAFLNMV